MYSDNLNDHVRTFQKKGTTTTRDLQFKQVNSLLHSLPHITLLLSNMLKYPLYVHLHSCSIKEKFIEIEF